MRKMLLEPLQRFMFRSPQKLRSGSKGQPVPLSAGDKRKTARSLSTPESSASPESSAPSCQNNKDAN
ncbi:hypothetical protein J6590_101338 [Homalodisca vitripennis]|nr:hypothetical protein J6590_101338 [Homalodisca vitripennis]